MQILRNIDITFLLRTVFWYLVTSSTSVKSLQTDRYQQGKFRRWVLGVYAILCVFSVFLLLAYAWNYTIWILVSHFQEMITIGRSPRLCLIVSSHINEPVEHTWKAELCAAGAWIMHPYFTDGNTEAHNEKSLAGTQKALIQLRYSLRSCIFSWGAKSATWQGY